LLLYTTGVNRIKIILFDLALNNDDLLRSSHILFPWLLLLLLLYIAGYFNTHLPHWFEWARYLSYDTYTIVLLSYIEFQHGTAYQLGLIIIIYILRQQIVKIIISCWLSFQRS